MAASVIFAILLLIVSGALFWTQLETARQTRDEELDEDERRYLERRGRRRMLASSLIGVVAGLILGGLLVRDRLSIALYWFGVLLVTLCIGGLAVMDLISTRAYYTKVRNRHAAERTALEAEIARLKRRSGKDDS